MPNSISSISMFAALAIAGFAAGAANASTLFIANLTGAQETVPNGSAATGTGTFVLNDALTALSYDITILGLDFTGAQTPGTTLDDLIAAHIHAPGAPGTNAGVVFGFFGTPFNDNAPNDVVVTPFASGVGGTISGKWDLLEGNGTTLAAQLPNLFADLAYVNFHTTQFPGGEIRGQILETPIPGALPLFAAGVAALGFFAFGRMRRHAA